MRKTLLSILTVLLLCISCLCSASDGKDLDYQQKVVDTFMAGKSYGSIASYLDPEMRRDFTEKDYKDMFASMDKSIGRLQQKDFIAYQKLEGGSLLRYKAKFERAGQMQIIAAFRDNGGKFTLTDLMVLEPSRSSLTINIGK